MLTFEADKASLRSDFTVAIRHAQSNPDKQSAHASHPPHLANHPVLPVFISLFVLL